MAYPMQHGYYQPPPKRRGVKRIIFGVLGIIANGFGVFALPVVLLFVGGIITALTMDGLQEIGPEGGSFRAEGFSVYSIAVPIEEAGAAECTFEGIAEEDVERSTAELEVSHEGRTYVEIYDLTTVGEQEVQVTCPGVSNVGYTEMGMAGTLISMGAGVVIPILLGLLSLGLLIWGIIALLRSS